MKNLYFLFITLFLLACSNNNSPVSPKEETSITTNETVVKPPNTPYLVVLGIAQDAGFPQANCQKSCCKVAWNDAKKRKLVSCIALVEPDKQQAWIFDATPDFKEQLKLLENLGVQKIAGIFLTHAHIGHYTGLMDLGREAMGANKIPVYAMPKMKQFLETNGPWSQLVVLENIKLHALQNELPVDLGNDIAVTPYQVPHRDEYSETVGFKIKHANKTAMFIPDIDKWHKWDQDIKQFIKDNDFAFLDGTFYANGEIPGRDMALIPHPFLAESMDLFKDLAPKDKAKVHFIHFNHTNPVLQENSEAKATILSQGYFLAEEMQFFTL